MSISKKSINVELVRTSVNEVLALSVCSPDTRQGMMNVLEKVLHASGNYKGFRYLAASDVPAGQSPGINMELILSDDYVAKFANTDKTRVQYF